MISRQTPDGTLSILANSSQSHTYAHVICAIPLGALQAINTTSLNLSS
jgi:hypothetical protein